MSTRIDPSKRAYILAALNEGTPINAVCRIFKAGKHGVLRLIAEAGEAMAHYMDTHFRNLECGRIEMDECWTYVFKHGHQGQKTVVREEGKGDYWLWCAVDADSKLVLSHHVGRRDGAAANAFIEDLTSRVEGPAQYASDPLFLYLKPMMRHGRGYAGNAYGTETKLFLDPANPERILQRGRRPHHDTVVKSVRETVFGQTALGLLTTAHCERIFLSVRQELVRFTRMTLAYSKSLEMHKHAVALYFATYNLVRKHHTLDQTPAQAAGVTSKRWTWADVVAYTDSYWQPCYAQQQADKKAAKRESEDKAFLVALAALEKL